MAKRQTLKTYFETGKIPTQEHFAGLIDSSYNVEDGNLLPNNVNNPLKIGSGAETLGPVINFYKGAVQGNPAWGIRMGAGSDAGLAINDAIGNRILIRENSGEIEIGRTDVPTILKFKNAIGNSIQMWTDSNDGSFYGLEVLGNTLKIQTDYDEADVVMGYNTTGDPLKFVETMRVKGNGNVGIGTSGRSPRSKLDIWGGALYVTDTNSGTAIVTTRNDIAYFAINDINNGISIGSSGNVGIGTNAPAAKLTIDAGEVDYTVSYTMVGSVQIPVNAASPSKGLVEIAKMQPWTLGGNKFVSKFHHQLQARDVVTNLTADFAELFESENQVKIPIGTAVILTNEGQIRPAKTDEVPLGVISSTPAIICNNADEWPGKYLRDEFGQPLTEEKEVEVVGSDGKKILEQRQVQMVNPLYDPTREYIPRQYRPEWHPVGLLGQLHLRKGQPVAPTWVKIKDVSENVELWLVK